MCHQRNNGQICVKNLCNEYAGYIYCLLRSKIGLIWLKIPENYLTIQLGRNKVTLEHYFASLKLKIQQTLYV